MRGALVALAVGALLCVDASAQSTAAVWSWGDPAPEPPRVQSAAPSASLAALASLALPGAGQHRLGQRRKWIYLAVEAVSWARFLERRSAGKDLRGQYRDLAWNVARMQGPFRVEGEFEYYETMSQWVRSGAFDRDPDRSGVQPETEDATYNGSIWTRARAIFFPAGQVVMEGDPAHQRALTFYGTHAFDERFLWDWSGRGDEQTRFADLIVESDDRFRQATTAVGVVLLNHLVAAVDAYASGRSNGVRTPRARLTQGADGRVQAMLRLPLTPR